MEQQQLAQNDHWIEVLAIHDQGYRPRGDWVPDRDYEYYDVVTAHARLYVCIRPHVSAATNAPPESTFAWFERGELRHGPLSVDVTGGCA